MSRKLIVTDSANYMLRLTSAMATLSVDQVEEPKLDADNVNWVLNDDRIIGYLVRRYGRGEPLPYPNLSEVRMDHSGAGFYWVTLEQGRAVWREIRVIA
jgi:hypothetical protein